MNWQKRLPVVLTLVTLASVARMLAQPRFEIPLTVTDGVMSQILYFGILPGGHFCIVESDSINGHVEFDLPFTPPAGVFDAWFVWPRTGSNLLCFGTGSYNDYRPFITEAQRDTFRVISQFGMGTIMVISWPSGLSARFTQLTLRYFDQIQATWVTINMLTNTTADVTGGGDLARVTIYSGGLAVSVGEMPQDMPARFELHQNYPNPFNPSTTIRYRLAQKSFVTLSVYNTLGQEVAQPANEQQQAGNHAVDFRGDGLPSGVYIYRLTTPRGTIARKMLLLK